MNMINKLFCSVVVLLLSTSCSTLLRNPVPENLTEDANLITLGDVRFFGDGQPDNARKVVRQKVDQSIAGRPDEWSRGRVIDANFLIITGGGSNGAYGAGLLNGMTDSGNRPKFEVITGVSTGALLAPFAFLGSDYDSVIKELYTQSSTKDILRLRNALIGIFSSSLGNSEPLQQLIARYITMDFMEKVADEYQIGRRLFVGTTNIDAQRPVIWDMGKIATYGTDEALGLFRKVLLASASIPAAFPAVTFQVEADGRMYEELHVDGGVTNNAFFLPLNVGLASYLKELGLQIKPTMYVIRNSRSAPAWESVKNKALSIARRSIDTLGKNSTTGDLHKLYTFTQINGAGYRITSVPSSFNEPEKELFDPVYQRKLYQVGYDIGLNGIEWETTPPGL